MEKNTSLVFVTILLVSLIICALCSYCAITTARLNVEIADLNESNKIFMAQCESMTWAGEMASGALGGEIEIVMRKSQKDAVDYSMPETLPIGGE